jgi:hypothetical protein
MNQGTWNGKEAHCPACALMNEFNPLLVSVTSLLMYCKNGHKWDVQGLSMIYQRLSSATED